MNSKTEINHLLKMIRLERAEEVRRSQEILDNVSLEERRAKGITWHPVVITHEEIGIGEQLVLDIERTKNTEVAHKFSQGQSAALFINNAEGRREKMLEGVIKRARRNDLQLVVKADSLPDWVDEGSLGLDLLYDETTYKEMEFALNRLLNAKDDRLAELREIILGYQKPYFEKLTYPINFSELNESQNQAVAHITSARDVAIVHGPPGTGKTTTLIRAIRHSMHEQSQILVAAPSNTAVDLLTEKLVEYGIHVVRMGHPARVDESLWEHTFDAKVEAHPDYKRMKDLRKDAHKLKQKAVKYKRTFNSEDREARREALKESKAMFEEARSIEKYILNNVLQKAEVITATLVGASQAMIRFQLYETVFIDEAGQALEPATWIPICRAKRVVFAGDHLQLPPTVKSLEAQKGGFDVSLFEKCVNRLKIGVMLETQYRMNERIMDFSSDVFYQNRLKAAAMVQHHVLATQEEAFLLQTPFDFIDTAGSGYEEVVKSGSLSKYNPEEGELLLKYMHQLYEQMEAFMSVEEVDKISVGIISPYSAQVGFLTDQLKEYPLLEKYQKNISVKTVDGFQGQERDVIGISLVRSNPDGEIGFLKDIRRMNVAMTRAKKKLVVVGDSATISQNGFYQRFLEYADMIGGYKTVWEFTW
ncbi:MAG: AAA domain-containing protein [Chitinophagales bacterium]